MQKGQPVRYLEIDKGVVKHDTCGQVQNPATGTVVMWNDGGNTYAERNGATYVLNTDPVPTADGAYAIQLS
jgi:hypothetical protein